MSTTSIVHPAPPSPVKTLRESALPNSSGWARLRRAVTIGVIVVATVAGVTVGVTAPDISPVAPAAPIDAAAAAPDLAAPVTPAAPATPVNPVTPDIAAGRRGGDGPGRTGRR